MLVSHQMRTIAFHALYFCEKVYYFCVSDSRRNFASIRAFELTLYVIYMLNSRLVWKQHKQQQNVSLLRVVAKDV